MQKNGGIENIYCKEWKERWLQWNWRGILRLFKHDYKRRMKMFDALVGSIALYEVEVWEWKKKKDWIE